MKKVTLTVTNDLTTDQRVHKVATSLQNRGYHVLLIGRKLPHSIPIVRDYETHRIDLFFNKGFLFYAEYNLRLFFYLLFKNKTILLANDLDTLLPNYLISKLQNKKLVYDSHELFTEVPELINRPKTQKIWLKIENRILPKLKNTYTVCDSIADYYNEKYNTNFKVIRNIPVLEQREERQERRDKRQETRGERRNLMVLPDFQENSKIIIYQGAINMGRGLELMIDTMAYLNDYHFIIIGDGDIITHLKQKVTKQKLTSNVHFLGKKTPSELKKITPLADLGISIEEDLGLNYRFALPNKIFDYIHANIPVLVSDLPEMKALVNTYQIGEIITDRTPKKLANQIVDFLNSDATVCQENLIKASTKLQWHNEEKILQKIFNNIS